VAKLKGSVGGGKQRGLGRKEGGRKRRPIKNLKEEVRLPESFGWKERRNEMKNREPRIGQYRSPLKENRKAKHTNIGAIKKELQESTGREKPQLLQENSKEIGEKL